MIDLYLKIRLISWAVAIVIILIVAIVLIIKHFR
jgi:hypothetical protein